LLVKTQTHTPFLYIVSRARGSRRPACRERDVARAFWFTFSTKTAHSSPMFLARRLLTASSSHLRSSSSFTPLKHTSLRCLSAMAGACCGGATKKSMSPLAPTRTGCRRRATQAHALLPSPFLAAGRAAAAARGGGARKKDGPRGAGSAGIASTEEGKAGDSPTTLPHRQPPRSRLPTPWSTWTATR
jgi:hypothetical protein